MFKRILIGLFILCISISSTVLAQNINAEEEAIAAAEVWIKLIDDGQYTESWEQASGYFKAVIKQEAWNESIKPLRESLGKVLVRKLMNHEFSSTMPGAPDGEYVIIQYETSFENKETAIETVTPMVDTDGVWRVSGYYIK